MPFLVPYHPDVRTKIKYSKDDSGSGWTLYLIYVAILKVNVELVQFFKIKITFKRFFGSNLNTII